MGLTEALLGFFCKGGDVDRVILNKANKTDNLQIFDLRLGCLILLFYYV